MALSWACFLLQLFTVGLLLRPCSANPPCTDLVISITAEASNEVFPIPTNFNYSDPNLVDALIHNIGANGPYPVQATSGTVLPKSALPAGQVQFSYWFMALLIKNCTGLA